MFEDEVFERPKKLNSVLKKNYKKKKEVFFSSS